MQLIQLTSLPNQTSQSVLSIDGENKTLQFFIRYNDIAGYWTMRITDTETSEVLIDSLPLVTADDPAANLLESYAYLKIGSAYLINVGNVSADPSEDDLGTNFVLFWGDTPE
jgi:hypothetical protein